jgi:hypothetical protein
LKIENLLNENYIIITFHNLFAVRNVFNLLQRNNDEIFEIYYIMSFGY